MLWLFICKDDHEWLDESISKLIILLGEFGLLRLWQEWVSWPDTIGAFVVSLLIPCILSTRASRATRPCRVNLRWLLSIWLFVGLVCIASAFPRCWLPLDGFMSVFWRTGVYVGNLRTLMAFWLRYLWLALAWPCWVDDLLVGAFGGLFALLCELTALLVIDWLTLSVLRGLWVMGLAQDCLLWLGYRGILILTTSSLNLPWKKSLLCNRALFNEWALLGAWVLLLLRRWVVKHFLAAIFSTNLLLT